MQDNNLLRHKFKLSIRGSNFKLTQRLAKNIIRQHSELKVCIYEVIDKAPHNGCKLKIKKRKKNKGKNRRRKKLVTRPTPLKKAAGAKLRLLPPGYGVEAFLLQKIMEDPRAHLMRMERLNRKRRKQAFPDTHKVKKTTSVPASKKPHDKYKPLKGVSIQRATVPSQSYKQFRLHRRCFKKLKTKQQAQEKVKSVNDSNFLQGNAN